MESEENLQLALLREEIRQAGIAVSGSVDHTRRQLGPLSALGCALTPIVAVIIGGVAVEYPVSGWTFDAVFGWVAAVGLVGSLVAVIMRAMLSNGSGALARFVIAGDTSVCRGKVRQRLASLSPEQQAAVLIPLRDHRTAGPIIAPFLREIDAHSELTTAAAPVDSSNYNNTLVPATVFVDQRDGEQGVPTRLNNAELSRSVEELQRMRRLRQ